MAARWRSAGFLSLAHVRYFADRGACRKDYSDPGFRHKGYTDSGFFGNTQVRPGERIVRDEPYPMGRYEEYRNGSRRRDSSRFNHDQDDGYPYTGRKLDEFSNRKQGANQFFNSWSRRNVEEEEEEFEPRRSRTGTGGAESDAEDELSLQVRSAIRRSLADDAEDGEATFHRPDGRLWDISGEMEADFVPAQQDEELVFEMTSLFKQGNVATWEAEDIVRMHGGRLRPYHVFEVLKVCQVDPSLSLAFFRWAGLQPGYQHGTSTFNMMLKILEERHRYAEMAELSKDMDSLEVPKSEVTYKILLTSFFKARRLEDALETFSQMETTSFPPAVADYKCLIRTMLSMECYPVVPVLFDKLTAAGNIPDAYIYNAVMCSYCNMAKMEQAAAMFEKMKTKCACDIFSYTILIDGYIKCYQVSNATSMFLEMLQKSCLPGEEIFNLLFGLHAKRGRLDQGVDLFRKIVENGCQPTLRSYGMLLDAFAQASNLEGAYNFFQELVSKGYYPSVISCNSLLTRLNKAGKTNLAIKFFEDMKSFPESKPSAVSYNAAIEALSKTGKYEDAWKTFEEMKTNGCTPCLVTYNNLILRLGRVGALETCFSLLDEMKGRGILPNQFTYTTMIEVVVRHNQLDQALQLLEEMRGCNFQPNITTLQLLIKCLWTSGNLAAAKYLCEQYPGVYMLENRPWSSGLPDGRSTVQGHREESWTH